MANKAKESDDVKVVDWQQVAKFNEEKANAALKKVDEYEEFLAEFMPDVLTATKYLRGLQVQIGVRYENAYRKVRELLGAKGEAIDKLLRT